MRIAKQIISVIALTVGLIVGGHILFEVARHTKRFAQGQYYGHMVRHGRKIAPSTEKLSQVLLESLKSRNKYNIESIYCSGVIGRLPRTGVQGIINNFWDETRYEDYSEAKVELIEPVFSNNKDIVISNIKLGNKTIKRDFEVHDATSSRGDYKCFDTFDRESMLEYKKKLEEGEIKIIDWRQELESKNP